MLVTVNLALALAHQVTAMDLEVLVEQLEGVKVLAVLVLIMDYL